MKNFRAKSKKSTMQKRTNIIMIVVRTISIGFALAFVTITGATIYNTKQNRIHITNHDYNHLTKLGIITFTIPSTHKTYMIGFTTEDQKEGKADIIEMIETSKPDTQDFVE